MTNAEQIRLMISHCVETSGARCIAVSKHESLNSAIADFGKSLKCGSVDFKKVMNPMSHRTSFWIGGDGPDWSRIDFISLRDVNNEQLRRNCVFADMVLNYDTGERISECEGVAA